MIQQTTLNVGIALPLALIGQKCAVLGMSGAGKSNTGAALAEEMHAVGAPWIVIDPKGDWHGVRSSKDGKGPGLDVPIIGGRNGDLPLPTDAGARLGELAATGKLRGVIDISEFDSDAQRSRFMADFGRALLKHANGTVVHIFCDECHEYMPQPGSGGRLDGPAAECVGVWKKVATKLRSLGVGFTLMSQRAALVNKTVLYQCETLIAMRMVGKRDKDAVADWAAGIGDAKELIRSLPLLEDGQGWVWSPQRLKITEKVQFRRRHTFDSGKTPEFGEASVSPKRAPVNIEALRELLTVEPVAQQSAGASRVDGAGLVELGALREENRRLKSAIESYQIRVGKLDECIARLRAVLLAATDPGEQPLPVTPVESSVVAEPLVAVRPAQPTRRVVSVSGIGKGEVLTLAALVQHHPQGCSREQLTILTGHKRSTRDAYLQRLRAAGFVEESSGQLVATATGRKVVPNVEPLPTGKALFEHWLAKLPAGEAVILKHLGSKPSGRTRSELSDLTSFARSTRDAYIQRLAQRKLVHAYSDTIQVSEHLR